MIPGPKAHLPGPFSHLECAVGALSFYVLASHAHSATQKATPVACSMCPCTGHFSILASVFFPVKWVSQAPPPLRRMIVLVTWGSLVYLLGTTMCRLVEDRGNRGG